MATDASPLGQIVPPRVSSLSSDFFSVSKKPSKESIGENRTTLKRRAVDLDIHTDPTTWWAYEDEHLRNEIDWFDLYYESERKKYSSGLPSSLRSPCARFTLFLCIQVAF